MSFILLYGKQFTSRLPVLGVGWITLWWGIGLRRESSLCQISSNSKSVVCSRMLWFVQNSSNFLHLAQTFTAVTNLEYGRIQCGDQIYQHWTRLARHIFMSVSNSYLKYCKIRCGDQICQQDTSILWRWYQTLTSSMADRKYVNKAVDRAGGGWSLAPPTLSPVRRSPAFAPSFVLYFYCISFSIVFYSDCSCILL